MQIRPIRRAAVAVAMLGAALWAFETAPWAAAKVPACAGGRYVISAAQRSDGRPALQSGTITIDGSSISLGEGCSGVARTRRLKGGRVGPGGGTRVVATLYSCANTRGKVRLKAAIDSTCKRMWGSVATRKGKSRFEAELSLCGNAFVDEGEECDGSACSDGAGCDACRCDRDGIPGPGCTPGVDPGCASGGVSSTTTTVLVDGGTTTSTSLDGGGVTSTTTVSSPSSTTTSTLPARDPFECYKLREEDDTRFKPGPLSLVDRFGTTAVLVQGAKRLCNPVDVDGAGVVDPTAHLMCYDLAPENGFVRRSVVTHDRFGDHALDLVRSDSLCVPAEKDGVQSQPGRDGFKCYRVAQQEGTDFAPRSATLVDQFETKTLTVQKPILFCTPAAAVGGTVADPSNDLTCYRVPAPADSAAYDVSVEDEFTEQRVRAFRGTCRKVALLCVPSVGGGTTTTTIVQTPTTSSSSSSMTTTSSTTSVTSPAPSTTSTSSPAGSTTTSSTPAGSTTSTSTTAATSSTATTPSTTVTTTSLASTTTLATPTTSTSSSSSTSTPSPSTTSTTIGSGGTACSANGLDVTVSLDYPVQIVGGVSAIFLKLGYPAAVTIPGTGTEATVRQRVTNLAGTGSSVSSIADRDTNANGVDDQLQAAARKTQGSLDPGAVFRVRFDCGAGTVVSPTVFACAHEQSTDLSGSPFAPELASQIKCVASLAAAP